MTRRKVKSTITVCSVILLLTIFAVLQRKIANAAVKSSIAPYTFFENLETLSYDATISYGSLDTINLSGETLLKAIDTGLKRSFADIKWIEIKSQKSLPHEHRSKAENLDIHFSFSIHPIMAPDQKNEYQMMLITNQLHKNNLKQSSYQKHVAMPILVDSDQEKLFLNIVDVVNRFSVHLASYAKCAKYKSTNTCKPLPKPFDLEE